MLSCSVVLSGCAADPPRAGGAQVGAQGGAPAKGDVELERLTTRLRDYVYATYEFDAGRDEPALERLRRAREALASAMTDAGLASKEQGLSGVVGALKDVFLARGDLVFVPLGAESAGVLLVRVAERRAEAERTIAGRAVGWKAVRFDEVVIEDAQGFRARVASAPAPMRPAVRAAGKTFFVDRAASLRLAREVVIPRADAARALEARAAKGEALTALEAKDLLRHRSLAPVIPSGDVAVARAIESEEELRAAAFLACAPLAARALEDPAVQSETERRAILAAVLSGEPRYHVASALSAVIAAPAGSAPRGAEAALTAFAGKPFAAWTSDELKDAARRALGKQ